MGERRLEGAANHLGGRDASAKEFSYRANADSGGEKAVVLRILKICGLSCGFCYQVRTQRLPDKDRGAGVS